MGTTKSMSVLVILDADADIHPRNGECYTSIDAIGKEDGVNVCKESLLVGSTASSQDISVLQS